MSTLSVFKASCGGYVGAGGVHAAVVDAARGAVAEAKDDGVLADAFVARCGDDVAVVCLHADGVDTDAVARATFSSGGAAAADLGQHAVSRNGARPIEAARVRLDARASEPVLCFLADKAPPGAWNLHLHKVFADPFNTPALLTDPEMAPGFRFTILEPISGTERSFDLPDDLHSFLAAASSGRGMVVEVVSRASGRIAAAASAGPEPVLLIRCESPFPTVGAALEPFAFPYAVGGWAGHSGPLVPVATTDDASSRSDGPPRAIGLGFQVTSTRLVGPRDLLGDVVFDEARRQAFRAADYLRRHGPFTPGIAAPAARTANGGAPVPAPRA